MYLLVAWDIGAKTEVQAVFRRLRLRHLKEEEIPTVTEFDERLGVSGTVLGRQWQVEYPASPPTQLVRVGTVD